MSSNSKKRKFALALIAFVISTPGLSLAKYHKKQDADYVKEWCDSRGGTKWVRGETSSGKRVEADCVTDKFAVEVDSAEDWERNLMQAKKYGSAFDRTPMLVLVVEEPHQRKYVEEAKKFSIDYGLGVRIESLENFKSLDDSLNEIDEPIVKMSTRGICHVKGFGAYGQTRNYDDYDNLDDCLAAGGRLPKRVIEANIRRAEKRALKALKKTRKAKVASGTISKSESKKTGVPKGVVLFVLGVSTMAVWAFRSTKRKVEADKKVREQPLEAWTDPHTPVCQTCNVKMVQREFKIRKRRVYRYWGCQNYPRCNENKVLVSTQKASVRTT